MTGGVYVVATEGETHALVEDVQGTDPIQRTHPYPRRQGSQERVHVSTGTIVRNTWKKENDVTMITIALLFIQISHNPINGRIYVHMYAESTELRFTIYTL